MRAVNSGCTFSPRKPYCSASAKKIFFQKIQLGRRKGPHPRIAAGVAQQVVETDQVVIAVPHQALNRFHALERRRQHRLIDNVQVDIVDEFVFKVADLVEIVTALAVANRVDRRLGDRRRLSFRRCGGIGHKIGGCVESRVENRVESRVGSRTGRRWRNRPRRSADQSPTDGNYAPGQ